MRQKEFLALQRQLEGLKEQQRLLAEAIDEVVNKLAKVGRGELSSGHIWEISQTGTIVFEGIFEADLSDVLEILGALEILGHYDPNRVVDEGDVVFSSEIEDRIEEAVEEAVKETEEGGEDPEDPFQEILVRLQEWAKLAPMGSYLRLHAGDSAVEASKSIRSQMNPRSKEDLRWIAEAAYTSPKRFVKVLALERTRNGGYAIPPLVLRDERE